MDEPAHWTTYRTATWLGGKREAMRQAFGFVAPAAEGCTSSELRDDLALMGKYIERNLLPDGRPRYAQMPITGTQFDHGSAARVIFTLASWFAAARVLRRPDWQEIAKNGIRQCLDKSQPTQSRDGDEQYGPMADCMLLLASGAAGLDSSALVRKLFGRVDSLLGADGIICPPGQPVRAERDNDYLPNVAALALARLCVPAPSNLRRRLEQCHLFQRQRFRNLHNWGQAGWLPQACAELHGITGDEQFAETAFEVADWCIDHQVAATGAFLTDLAPGGPTFHTAFVAEGMADAWRLALGRGDKERAERYERSWHAAMRFARQLVIRPVDAPYLRRPSESIGGVRQGPTNSFVRIDFVGHLMAAITKGLQVPASPRRGARRQ
jgi:hypothetical protein